MSNWILGALRVALGLDTAEFESGARDATRSVKSLERDFDRFGQRMVGMGGKLSLAITAPLVLFGKQAFTAASDAAELQSAFDVTFGALAKDMNKWAVATGDSLGRSTQSIQEMANTFGIFFNQAAPTRKEAAEMSKTFTVLAQDLSSFFNVTEDEALQKLRSGLSGESEPLRDFGVFLNEAAVKAKALEMGLKPVGGQLTEQQKILARYNLILEATKAAQGDVIRTSSGTANQIRAMQAAWDELKVTIGEKLLPALTPLIGKLGALLNYISELPDGLVTFIVGAGALAAALGPVLVVLGSVVSMMSPLLAGLAAGTVSVAAILGPLAAFAALGALIYENWDSIGPALKDFAVGLGLLESDTQKANATLADMFDGIREKAVSSGAATKDAADKIADGLREMAETGTMNADATAALGDLIAKMQEVGTIAPEEASKIRQAWLDAYNADYATGKKSGWEQLGDNLRDFGAELKGFSTWLDESYSKPVAATMREFWSTIGGGIASASAAWNSAWAAIGAAVQKAVTAISNYIGGGLKKTLDWVEDKVRSVGATFEWLYDAVVGHSYIPDMVDGIAQHMARLEGVMVAPAKKAATSTAEAMRQMASDVDALLERLFPASAALKQYREELTLLEKAQAKGLLGADAASAARGRLDLEYLTGGTSRQGPDFSGVERLDKGVSKVVGSIEKLGKKAETVNARIVKSFKDMADDTLRALDGLASAVKGGSFLDILSSVLGLATQLGSIGVFGKATADRINAPRYADGTDFHPGGLALVGERGPEVVNLPRGSQVWPNGTGPGGGGATVLQIVPSKYFDVLVDGKVQRASGPIMLGAKQVTLGALQRQQSRRVA